MNEREAPERAIEIRPTPVQPGSPEARLMASIEYLSREDGLGFSDDTICRFACALLSRGLTIRPLVTRF